MKRFSQEENTCLIMEERSDYWRDRIPNTYFVPSGYKTVPKDFPSVRCQQFHQQFRTAPWAVCFYCTPTKKCTWLPIHAAQSFLHHPMMKILQLPHATNWWNHLFVLPIDQVRLCETLPSSKPHHVLMFSWCCYLSMDVNDRPNRIGSSCNEYKHFKYNVKRIYKKKI